MRRVFGNKFEYSISVPSNETILNFGCWLEKRYGNTLVLNSELSLAEAVVLRCSSK